MELAGKVALVTGATTDLGKAIALGLASKGARLLLVASDLDDGHSRQAFVAAGSPSVAIVAADVATLKGLDAVVLAAVREFDGFDILVNVPVEAKATAVALIDDEGFDRLVLRNLRAPCLLTQSAVKTMRRKGGGTVVQVVWDPDAAGQAVRSACGAGLRAFTSSVRLEVEPSIRLGIVVCQSGAAPASVAQAVLAIAATGAPEIMVPAHP